MIGANGGLIGARRVPSTSSASGIWSQNEQSLARREDLWPRSANLPVARYFRFLNFADTALNADAIDFGEIEFYNQATKHTGIICTANFTFSGSGAGALVDGVTGTATRAFCIGWASIRSTAVITFDLGSPKTLSHVQVYSVFTQPRFPASFELQSSDDNSNYQFVSRIVVGTSFTDIGNSTFRSEKISVF